MNLKRGALKAILTLTASAATLSLATAANAAVYWPTAADNLSKTTFAVDSQENFASTQGYSTLFNSKDQLCETLGESPCANVGTDINNPQREAQENDYARTELKAMIERKRRNDFVRKREFDMLRKLRRNEAVAGVDLTARPSFFQSSMPSRPDDRASTLKKIDEIEAQMSQQWWKARGGEPGGGPTVSRFSAETRLSELQSTNDMLMSRPAPAMTRPLDLPPEPPPRPAARPAAPVPTAPAPTSSHMRRRPGTACVVTACAIAAWMQARARVSGQRRRRRLVS